MLQLNYRYFVPEKFVRLAYNTMYTIIIFARHIIIYACDVGGHCFLHESVHSIRKTLDHDSRGSSADVEYICPRSCSFFGWLSFRRGIMLRGCGELSSYFSYEHEGAI